MLNASIVAMAFQVMHQTVSLLVAPHSSIALPRFAMAVPTGPWPGGNRSPYATSFGSSEPDRSAATLADRNSDIGGPRESRCEVPTDALRTQA